MNLISLSKYELRDQLISLMDTVVHHLETDPDVDKFLDETDLFDEWEKVLPDAEYPIFIMAVLNNTRRDSIMDTIMDAILEKGESAEIPEKNVSEAKPARSHVGEHPFN
ncbi:MAG TPA: hypothetical protein EYM60_04100 [Candidatus Marinimicrobia bacterium]|nr:hypothetical protein [Candidatus Neomarinimicrobiota bacterium]